ncbi:MAG: NUDIX hydrolase [Gemmatimonadaceae bacterium]|jgi:8-oxo-dGTP diphosphatase|nr:NUDIX hydrolase [Gemmatimonadaceae bacterium]
MSASGAHPASPHADGAPAPHDDAVPRVGVGVLCLREGRVLLGRRLGSHGTNTWAPPGGYLDFGESIEACAARELMEETGLVAAVMRCGPYTNDVFVAEARHSLTCFVMAAVPVGVAERREPEKCAGWEWCDWDALPAPLFQPLVTLRETGFDPRRFAW